MDKKVLQGFVQQLVDKAIVAHGNNVDNKDDQTMGRSLIYMALKKNADAIVAATNPPQPEDVSPEFEG